MTAPTRSLASLCLILCAPSLGAAPPAPASPGGPGSSGIGDLVIPAGTTVVVDTDDSVFTGTQGELLPVVRGLLVVNDLVIEDGAVLRAQGRRFPFRVHALGSIRISGELDVDGASAKDVAGINTAVFPEPGAAGNGGGGRGGGASMNTMASTPAGEDGRAPRFSPFASGGGGGESGYGGTQSSDPALRRAGGGGGGAFGPDVAATTPASLGTVGLAAQPGADGALLAAGAQGGIPPRGGAPGRSPFADGDPANDFWGVGEDPVTGELVVGELRRLWAGSGGGGGGDSVRSVLFPHPSFSASTDDKGGAGGGGAGGLLLSARGVVRLWNPATGVQGRIHANGGRGARGQLVQYLGNFFVPSGSGGGGGSGGHVVIQSLRLIDLGFEAGAVEARGGAGGPATEASGTGRGGDGGPGIVQLHVPGGRARIRSALPLDEMAVPAPKVLLPFSPEGL